MDVTAAELITCVERSVSTIDHSSDGDRGGGSLGNIIHRSDGGDERDSDGLCADEDRVEDEGMLRLSPDEKWPSDHMTFGVEVDLCV